MTWISDQISKIGMWSRIIGILMMGISGYLMTREPLWNYETLVLFIGFWLAFSGFLVYRASFRDQIRYFILSSAGGFLAAWGFPPSPFLPLIMVAFAVLFYLESERFHEKISGKWFLFYVFNFFFIWNIWTTFWISNTAFSPGIVGILINSALMTLTVFWANWLHRRINVDWYFGWVFIACWLTFEFIHLRWEMSWPWLTIGNALAEWVILAQWYEFTGVLGGTIWVLWSNYMLFSILYKYKFQWKKLRFRHFSNWLVLIFVPILISIGIFITTDVEGTGSIANTVVINPNIEPHFEKFNQDMGGRWTIYEHLLNQSLQYDPELVVFPETIFEQIDLDDINDNPYIDRMERWIDTSGADVDILLGVTSFRIFEKGVHPDRSSVRTSTARDGRIYQWEVYNSAILLGSDTIPVYHKQKLVPGAELFPYRKPLFFLRPIVDKLGGSIYGYGRPASQNVFQIDSMKIAPIICYESIYGEYMRKYIADGANVLGIITNDGWWGDTYGHIQHYQFAALRAVEFRRSVLRSANMGFSGAFDIRGSALVTHNKYDEQAVIPVTVALNDELTFYSIWGDYLGRFSIFLVVFFTLRGLVNTIIGRKVISK